MKLTAVFTSLALALPAVVNAQIPIASCTPATRRLCCTLVIPGGILPVGLILALLGNPTLPPVPVLNINQPIGLGCSPILGTSCPAVGPTTPLCCGIPLAAAGANCQAMIL